MFKIEQVEIKGIWGWKNIKTSFFDDVTLFIGLNGSGKTTFINILISVLNVDVASMSELWFDSMRVKLSSVNSRSKKKQVKTIEVIRGTNRTSTSDTPITEVVTYRISRKEYKIPLFDQTREAGFIGRKYFPVIREVKEILNSIVSISSLSVSRAGISDLDDSHEWDNSRKRNVNAIDQTLERKLEYLRSYQLNLSERAKEIAREFQDRVMISMLYNEKIDSIKGISKISDSFLEKEREEFLETYSMMGIQNISRKGEAQELIRNHFDAIEESIAYLKNMLERKEYSLEIEKVLAFPLLKRTREMLNAGRDAEKKRKILFAPIDLYLKELSSFFINKVPRLLSDGSLMFTTDDGRNRKAKFMEYNYKKLSSGEKQVLIILTEALLQQGRSKVFIADEPELSLHIDWQRKIIPSVRNLNKNAQVIVATHSPEVAGEYADKLYDMEEISNG